jgi:hypothetical protein
MLTDDTPEELLATGTHENCRLGTHVQRLAQRAQRDERMR